MARPSPPSIVASLNGARTILPSSPLQFTLPGTVMRTLKSEVWGSEYALVATPLNGGIGFVLSSFSFRVVRASGRGEAVRVRKGQGPPLLCGPSGSEFRCSFSFPCPSGFRGVFRLFLWRVRGLYDDFVHFCSLGPFPLLCVCICSMIL